jgi:hypothetical protein
MHWLFNLVLYYPIWSIPVGLGALQVALSMYRRGSKSRYFWGALGAFLLVTAVLWLIFRGDLHGATWLEESFGVQQVQWD